MWSVGGWHPILNIMDCGAGNVGDLCTGIGTPMQLGEFPGQAPSFNGVVTSVVPVPASIWLFGSGVLGLFGFSKIRN